MHKAASNSSEAASKTTKAASNTSQVASNMIEATSSVHNEISSDTQEAGGWLAQLCLKVNSEVSSLYIIL